MKHKFLSHSDCKLNHCNICDGGLQHCTVCEGTESSLPTECPGKPMTDNQEIRVANNESDFINGKWRNT